MIRPGAVRAVAPALLAAGCAAFAPASLEVREVARSAYCNTPGEDAAAGLLPDAAAVLAFQAARGITLLAPESGADGPYALVEMGLRSTGGYALGVAPAAVLRDGTVVLEATFTAPAPGSLRTQALSSPCVLVRLPPGTYAGVEVRDAAGTVRARGSAPPAVSGGGGDR